MSHRSTAALVALLSCCPVAGQAPVLRYRPESVPAGKVFYFQKSNLDGSGAVEVALYVAAADRIEQVESLPNGGGGFLVRGEIDWKAGAPRRLDWWFLGGGERQLLGTLEAQPAARTVEVELFAQGRPRETIAVPAASWDVYAFNLPALGLLLGQLADPEAAFDLGVASLPFEPGQPGLKLDGLATLTFSGDEERAGIRCRKYLLAGPGIGDQGATLWADAASGTLVELAADKAAEPDWKGLRLVWKRTETADRASWERLLSERTGTREVKGPVAAETVAPHPCKVPGLDEEVRCATLAVWEDRAAKKGRKIGLNVVILPALGPEPAADPIFLFGGGPGEGITEAAAGLAGEEALRKKRDIVLVDQRGTGRSNPLDCELYGAPVDFRLAAGDVFPVDRVLACRRRLEQVADLALYTTDLGMDDVDEVRAFLGYAKINLHGGSYGTRAAQVYLRRHPETVRSAVLVAVAPVDVFLPLRHAYAGQRALDLLFADCAEQPACRAAFPDLSGDLAKVFARLRAGVSVTVTNTRTGERQEVTPTPGLVAEGIRFAMYGAGGNSVPLYIHRAARGDLAPLVQMSIENRLLLDGALATGMLFSVSCAEDLPYISDEMTERETRATLLGDYRVRQQKAVCAVWPRGRVPADVHELVRSDVPVFVLSGERDPVTPPEFGERVASRLTNSLHVVVPRGAHGGGECTNELVEQFIDRGTLAGLDPSCVRRAPPTEFMLP